MVCLRSNRVKKTTEVQVFWRLNQFLICIIWSISDLIGWTKNSTQQVFDLYLVYLRSNRAKQTTQISWMKLFFGSDKSCLFPLVSWYKKRFKLSFGLLGEKDSLDVVEDTSLGNGDSGQEFVQLFLIPDGKVPKYIIYEWSLKRAQMFC